MSYTYSLDNMLMSKAKTLTLSMSACSYKVLLMSIMVYLEKVMGNVHEHKLDKKFTTHIYDIILM